MIVPPRTVANSSARADLPLAVGPATTTTGEGGWFSRGTGLLRFALLDEQIGCHCEERSDEAISRHELGRHVDRWSRGEEGTARARRRYRECLVSRQTGLAGTGTSLRPRPRRR